MQNSKDERHELKDYFKEVILWVKNIFNDMRQEMNGVDWGLLYENYREEFIDIGKNHEKVQELIIRDEIEKRYLLLCIY